MKYQDRADRNKRCINYYIFRIAEISSNSHTFTDQSGSDAHSAYDQSVKRHIRFICLKDFIFKI